MNNLICIGGSLKKKDISAALSKEMQKIQKGRRLRKYIMKNHFSTLFLLFFDTAEILDRMFKRFKQKIRMVLYKVYRTEKKYDNLRVAGLEDLLVVENKRAVF